MPDGEPIINARDCELAGFSLADVLEASRQSGTIIDGPTTYTNPFADHLTVEDRAKLAALMRDKNDTDQS